MKKLSLVVPCYYNELNVPDTVPELLALGDKLPDLELELVFVDDGSGDRTLELLLEFQRRYPEQIKVVKLTRNFGAVAAAQAGFTVATGDCVGMTAADLQDPPEMFIEMARHWAGGIKAVYAVRVDREEPFAQKAFSKVYHLLMRKFALPTYPEGGFDTFLVDRQVIDELNRMREKNTSITSLVNWLGHAHVTIPFVRRRRKKGKSRWTLTKKIKYFIDSFVALSYAPIRLLSVTGLIVALSSFVYAGVVIYSWASIGIQVKGWASMVAILSFVSGVQMMMLGVLGEYLWRALDETRRRPPFVIDEIFAEHGDPDARAAGGVPRPATSARVPQEVA
jgi:dolichol-phosphate mannosyltransferase